MSQFDRIYIEISNICNLQCSFCPEVEREKKVLSPEGFQEILGKVKNHSDFICLHLMGEPLAHPDFPAILKIAEEEKIKIILTTNAIYLGKYKSILLASSAIHQVNISLQAYLDNFPSGNWRQFIESVFDIADTTRTAESSPYINFRLWNLGVENQNDLVFDIIKERYGQVLNRNIDPSFKKSKKIVDKLYLHFDTRFDWPSLNFPSFGETGTCHGLIRQLGIHTDGRVVPCCLDKEGVINLGNIFEQSLEEILQSQRSQDIITGFQAGKMQESLCQKCPYARRFVKKAKKLQMQAHSL